MMQQDSGLSIDVTTLGLANSAFRPSLMPRPHRHNEVELNFLEAGTMTYIFGGERAVIQAGQVALFWAAIPHQVVQIEGVAMLHWVTVPFATFLQWQLPDILAQRIIRGKFVQSSTEIPGQAPLALFRQWHNDLKEQTEEHRKIVLLEIEAQLRRLALFMDMADEQEENVGNVVPAHKPGKIEQMASFIAEHYTEPIHVEEIARSVHLHPNYAMSLFRKHCGVSIVEYVTQYRLAHAQRLLIMTTLNASEVALESGFGSVSRFYSAFKCTCGQSPGEYRTGLRKAPNKKSRS